MRTDVMFLRNHEECTDTNLTSNQKQAVAVYNEAQKQELEGNCEASWKLYRRAFHLWPKLETLDFDGLQ